MRVLGVDHGEKRIGIAVSDPNGRMSSRLCVIAHRSREADARRVTELARELGAERIVVGQSFDEHGGPNVAGRRAARFAAVLAEQSNLKVLLWDESLSTADARRALLEAGAPRRKRGGHHDDLAAAILLQSYLDSGMTDG
jgi:putative Holliday junction resolvase